MGMIFEDAAENDLESMTQATVESFYWLNYSKTSRDVLDTVISC